MNESDLIKRFRELINLIQDKESRVKYASDSNVLNEEIKKLKEEKDLFCDQLIKIQDKKVSSEKLANVKTMVQRLHDKFVKKYTYNFSRDQGMIVHGFILLRICEDISYALDQRVTYPSDYYLEVDGDFDITEVVKILKSAIDHLSKSDISNYVELFEYVRSVQRQIVKTDENCGRMKI
jgi:hypothetical protein